MHKQGFHSIAHRHILHFGIERNALCAFYIRRLIYVHMADAVGMPHDGDFGVVHDVLHEFIAAARDDQVDEVVQFENGCDFFSRFQKVHPPFGDAIQVSRCSDQDFGQCAVGVKCFAAAFEHDGIARF